MSTAEYFEDINDDIVGANEKTSMTHQPKPEVKCEKQCKVLECENGVFGMYHLKCNCECHDTPASTEVCACDNPRGFYNQLNERTISYDCRTCGKPIHLELTKPSPASTEVKVTPCKGNFRTCGGKCDICVGLLSFSTSTEEWEKEFDEKFPQASFTPPKEANLGNSILITVGRAESKKAFIRSLLSSHDQQLRQRIVERIKLMQNESEMREMAGIKYSDGFHKALSDLLTFITNLK